MLDNAKTEPVNKKSKLAGYQSTLTIGQVILFLGLVLFGAWLADAVLGLLGLGNLRPIVITTGAYGLVVILPLAYLFSPQLFTKHYWRLPLNIWKGVGIIVALQIVINFVLPRMPVDRYIAIGALSFAPLLEEIMRAVMICSLVGRWGKQLAILVPSILFALVHQHPVEAMFTQTALSVMFVWTDESILANIVAHFLMNAVVILHSGLGPT